MTMEQCQTPGCKNPVQRHGYKLCLDCWKKNNPRRKSEGDSDGISSTKIAEHFGVKPALVNAILNEIGWISRDKKGWFASSIGLARQAREKKHYQSGVPYVVWPQEILQNKILCAAVEDYRGQNAHSADSSVDAQKKDEMDDFRNKFPATFRATDGHFVRSKAEMLIDNFLYTAGVVHAYERKLPVEETAYSDFYLPGGKVYIEYWGLENDAKYQRRKEQKIEIYKKYKFQLIELDDNKVRNLDDHLPRLLLAFGIAVD